MKNFTKKNLVSVLITMVTLLLPVLAFAQTDPGGGPEAPIDGGLSVLLAAGAAYGVKKYRDHKKKGAEGEVEK